jgi:hypothetical protein
MSTNIIQGIQDQCNRVRRLIEIYETDPMGFIAIALMEQDIKTAENAIASGDTVAMVAI